MKLSPSAEQNSLARREYASQQLIATWEARLSQVTKQLLAAKAGLVRESPPTLPLVGQIPTKK